MKKALSIIAAFLIIGVLSACNGGDDVPTELTTERTDSYELTREYEGTSFARDGIGVVNLVACIDGDTARFHDPNGSHSSFGNTFNVRFFGVDTPESTSLLEPWGKAASAFVCDVLENAEEIVLEYHESMGGRIDSTGSRPLAYVWYDGRLLNLELVELAFSTARGLDAVHGAIMLEAMQAVEPTGRRVYGELDPDYSDEVIDVTIDELISDRFYYVGRYVEVQGTITRVREDGFTIEQDGTSVYVYAPRRTSSNEINDLVVGNKILLERVVPGYFPVDSTALNDFQLSNFSRFRYEILERVDN